MKLLNLLVFLLLLVGLSHPFTQAQTLSNQAKISLVTGTPGHQLYNCFGHSAIHIQDPVLGIDFLYNYGTFNFNTPNFYLKFVQRKLLYTLSKGSLGGLSQEYKAEGRAIAEQEFLLPQNKKQALFDRLNKNYQPENKEYLYDFFYDNCATRIRDILTETLGDDFELAEELRNDRFRSYLDEYLEKTPWMDLGIDIILGLEADKKANISDQMFLPDYLARNLAQSTFQGKPIMGKMQWRLAPSPSNQIVPSTGFSPFMVITIICLCLLLLSFLFKKNILLANSLDLIYFTILTLAGLLIAFLWFGTDHVATQNNLCLLWANPLYGLWLFIGWRKQKPARSILAFAYILLIFNILALLLFIVPIQQYNIACLPIILLSSIRIFYRLTIWGQLPIFQRNNI